MDKDFDVIVVGIGVMGASACHHLARRGLRVLGLEQFDIPHTLGSSHGLSRMIRLAYYEHPDYVPLLRRAYELWHELENLSGQKLLHITGGLYMGPADCELVSHSHEAAKLHGLPHEMLTNQQLKNKFPQFHISEQFVGMFEPSAGFLLPEEVVLTYVRTATNAGAEILTRRPVRHWSATPSGATVVTDEGEFRAKKLIFTAGPWTGQLLTEIGVLLKVTRQVMCWFEPRHLEDFRLGRFPVWAVDRPSGGIFYGFPVMDHAGLKIAIHCPGETTDPNRVRRDPQIGDVEEVREFLQEHMPQAQGPLISQRVCLYTNSPDSHFIVDRHPKYENVTFAAGFSGHGFKFASIIGEVLADLSAQGSTAMPAQFLNLKRFGDAII